MDEKRSRDISLENLLDVSPFQNLLESFTRLTGLPTAILDLSGKMREPFFPLYADPIERHNNGSRTVTRHACNVSRDFNGFRILDIHQQPIRTFFLDNNPILEKNADQENSYKQDRPARVRGRRAFRSLLSGI